MSVRSACIAALIIGASIGAAGCGKAATASDPTITASEAKRSFVARGFVVGCPNIAIRALPSFGIRARGAKSACPPFDLGDVSVYRTTADAKKSCAKNAKYFCVGPVYSVRNLIMRINRRDSAQIRRELLEAFRKFGTPVRIA